MVPEIQTLSDGTFLIDGLTLIEDVNERLHVHLFEPDYDTIAGYVLGKLNRLPNLNDTVDGDGVRIRVVEMDGMRISRVLLNRTVPPAISEEDRNLHDLTN